MPVTSYNHRIMNVQDYLHRIQYPRAVDRTAGALSELHVAHLLAVPFENLDIGMKRPILLDRRALWNKIVMQKRGGFCYELNGLFAWLLEQSGFEVSYLNGRVFSGRGKLGIEFDHLALLVRIPGESARWLADVGFGDSFTLPLDIDERGEQIQGLRAYRIEQVSEGYVVWQRNYNGTLDRQYFFDLQPRRFPDDYEAGCLYHQTSSDSSFTRESIISRATARGRISLEDGRLILTEDGRRTERLLKDEHEYRMLLKEHFNITLQKELS
jgi:N-hydroxyarylamine O-acetyltransferase